MLVLGRKQRQSVLIGDEITVTVEEISDAGDGRRIFGAIVRLGFEMPRYVPVCRSELQDRPPAARSGRFVPRPRPGELVELADAEVRLEIEVPRKVPVRHNGAPPLRQDSQHGLDGETDAATAVYHLTCKKDDRIAICHNIIIAALNFHRFTPSEPEGQKEAAAQRDAAEGEDVV